jgi:tetratricopeptide (TPR) repeat protein
MHRPQRASLGIVIADFENTTGDRDFDRALKTALTVDLEQSPFLAIAQRTNQVTGAPLSASTATEAIANPATDAVSLPVTRTAARETCQQLHDQAYLTGSIHRLSQKFLVSVEALDCSTNRNLAHSKGIADTADGVLSVLDKVAIDLRRQLGEPRQSVARFNQTLFGQRPPSLPALKAYSVAIALRATGKPREALLLLHRTTQLDPNFALAYSELGSIYADLGQHDLAATNLGKAYKLRDTVGDDQRFAITSAYHSLLTGDLQASIQNDKQWSELYPRNATPLVDLADLDIQIGKPAQALDSVRRALDLAPTNPQAYVTLARAEMHLGRLEEASATCQLAIARHQDVAPTHSILLQIAFLRLDQPAMDEQIAWAKGKPSEPYMQMQQALVYFATGKVKAAHSILSSLTAEASAESESQPASQFDPASDSKQLPETQATVPRIEAELGLPAAASAQLQHMPDRATSADIPVAWAEVGQTSRADSLRQRELETHPAATLWRDYYGPQISAAIALNQHKPDLAIQALQPASPYESKAFEVSALRGRAYLAGKQPALAEAEFHKILEHPGIDPLSHNYPLAQLGLARALAQQDKTVEASFAYKVVLQIWKDADPDLPPLREARATPVKSLPASRDHSSLSSRPKAAPLSAAHVAALRRR